MGVLIAGLLFASAASAMPTSLPVGELIQNGGFQIGTTPSLASWTTSSTGAVNARIANNAINTAVGNAGFNRFFEDAFAVLGDSDGNIAGGPSNGVSSISQSFTLSAIFAGLAIASYDLTISLESVFDGRGTAGTVNGKDIFSAMLTGSAFVQPLFVQNSDPLPNCGPAATCVNNQIMQDPFMMVVSGLSPGAYTLTIALNESNTPNAGATNTAAGIDNVSVTGLANPIPEPGIVWLSGVGLLLLGLARRRLA